MKSIKRIIKTLIPLSLITGSTSLLVGCSQQPIIEFNVPKIEIFGSMDGISKEQKVKVHIKYTDPINSEKNGEADATFKGQGEFSALFCPKKNYNIELFKPGTNYQEKLKVQLKDNGFSDNKYVLKGNYTDTLDSHNIVGAQIGGDLVRQRQTEHVLPSYIPDLSGLVNGGAIDGYPISLYHDGSFLGLYTLNLKKGKKLFNLDDGTEPKTAMFFADAQTDSTSFRKPISNLSEDGGEIEYCSSGETSEETRGVVDSFQNFLNFVMNSTDVEFKNNLVDYTDITSLIDYYLYVKLSAADDNIIKNIMGVTFDNGSHGIPSAYDLDYCFGFLRNLILPHDVDVHLERNLLFERLEKLFSEEIATEFKILRTNSLKEENIINKFINFSNSVTDRLYFEDLLRGPDSTFRCSKFNNIKTMSMFVTKRCEYLDKIYK